MTELPTCEFREPVEGHAELFYCRHQGVRSPQNLVPAKQCQGCTMRVLKCTNPRPKPTSEERKDFPSLRKQAWNLTKSLGAFVADGMKTVSKQEYEQRLEICDRCEKRQGNRCLECGCNLSIKAKGRAFQCPLDKWPSPTEPKSSINAHDEDSNVSLQK